MKSNQRLWLFASLAAAGCGETRAATLEPTPVSTITTATQPGGPPSAPEPAVARKQDPCPERMASIEGFCIDRHEAHLVARTEGGAHVRHLHHERPREGVTYEARSEAGVFPQAYVSRIEASAACANSGKRLCTMAEWQHACRGSRRTSYPYGNHLEPNRCNMGKPHLFTLLFGADPYRWTYTNFNDPALDQEPGFLARTGDHPACGGDAGVYDLVGNLHEWVSDTVDSALMSRLATEGVSRSYQPWRSGNGVFMGGFFSTREEHGPGCRFTTVAHEPRYHDYSTGFRCCADAADP